GRSILGSSSRKGLQTGRSVAAQAPKGVCALAFSGEHGVSFTAISAVVVNLRFSVPCSFSMRAFRCFSQWQRLLVCCSDFLSRVFSSASRNALPARGFRSRGVFY